MLLDNLEFLPDPEFQSPGDETDVPDDIRNYYRQKKPQRMIVLGEEGGGKTVAAIQLILDQLEHRKADEPVPFRVNATGWDGAEDSDLAGWLAYHLAIDYVKNPRVARALVDSGHILPVIDGLNEMDAPGSAPVRANAMLNPLPSSHSAPSRSRVRMSAAAIPRWGSGAYRPRGRMSVCGPPGRGFI